MSDGYADDDDNTADPAIPQQDSNIELIDSHIKFDHAGDVLGEGREEEEEGEGDVEFPAPRSGLMALIHSISEQNLALILMFFSAVFFSIMGIFVKKATQAGMSAFQLVFFRAGFQGVIVGSMIMYQGINWLGPPELRWWIVARGIFGGTSFICYFVTIQLLPIGDSIALCSLYPVATVVIARFLLNESLTPLKVAATTLCALGAFLIAQPSFIFSHHGRAEEAGASSGGLGGQTWLGYITAFGGTIGGGIVFVIMRRAKEAHTVQLVWSWVCGSALFSLILGNTISVFTWPTSEAWQSIVPLLLLGLCGHMLLNYAGRLAPAGPAALIRSSDVIYAYVWEYFIFGEDVNWITLLGAGGIVVGISLIAYSKYLKGRQPDPSSDHELIMSEVDIELEELEEDEKASSSAAPAGVEVGEEGEDGTRTTLVSS
eukprot:jgi/Bigna1/72114/fgenesh1_pg.18_\